MPAVGLRFDEVEWRVTHAEWHLPIRERANWQVRRARRGGFLRLTTGKSSANDTALAAKEAAELAMEAAEDPIFALVFSTEQYDHQQLANAMSLQLGRVPWAGCCTAGVFAGQSLLKQGIVVGVFSSCRARIGVGVAGPVSADGRAAGRTAAAQALAALPGLPGHNLALIVLPDALTGNAADVVRGAAEETGSGITWAGGGAGDNLRYLRTAQYAHGRAFQDHVVAIAMEDPRPLGAGIRHGWRPYGPPTMVTRARGPIAIELEYENAFDVYRRTVEEQGDHVSLESFAQFAITHPLGIPQADGEHVIRDPLAIEPDGSLRLVAEVPDGSLIRIMQGDREALISAAFAAASAAREAAGGQLGGALVFDCVSRSLMLGDSLGDELAAFQRGLGSGVPMLGCLTFGEVGALGTGVPQFHNKTAALLAVPA